MFRKSAFVFVFGILAATASYSQEIPGPSLPEEPKFEDIKVPDVKLEVPVISNYLYLMRGTALFADGTTQEGAFHFSNDVILEYTNQSKDSQSIGTVSLSQVERIEVVRWNSEQKDKNLYYLIPVEYKVYTNSMVSNYIDFKGNLPFLNAFIFDDGSSYKRFFTVYYDRWVEGKKGVFRWENSKANTFDYNFTHALGSVVREIRLNKTY